jgi:iron(III) transport system substrate-binding protein
MLLLACGTPAEPETPSVAKPQAQTQTTVTVYSGRGESLVGELFEGIPDDAPFRVEVQYGKTAEMVTRMVTEGAQSPADVIFVQDSGYLGVLVKQGALAPLPASVLI